MTGRRLDRGDWIDRSELIDIVQRQPALQNAPGAEWNYNNTAFGLAATIVERTSGQDFHVFMEENVFGPLGMTGSLVRPSPRHMVPNMSEGYTPTGDGYRQIGDLGGAVGAGSVYSTIGDLQTWIENYANPRVGTRASIDEMMTSFVLTDGEETGYGYGLFIDEQGGLTRGPPRRRGRRAPVDARLLPRDQRGHHHPEQPRAVRQRHGLRTGRSGSSRTRWSWRRRATRPQPPTTSTRKTTTLRISMNSPADMRWTHRPRSSSPSHGTATPSTDSRRGRNDSRWCRCRTRRSVCPGRGPRSRSCAERTERSKPRCCTEAVAISAQPRLADDAEEWQPGAEDLADFAGRFFSDEIETFYTFMVEEGELVMHQRRLDSATLTPGEKDNFSGGGLSFAFERDRNDQVIGFYLSNVRDPGCEVRAGAVRGGRRVAALHVWSGAPGRPPPFAPPAIPT